jgi:hypothetical protein
MKHMHVMRQVQVQQLKAHEQAGTQFACFYKSTNTGTQHA